VGTAVFKEKLLCVTSITQVLEAVLRKMCSTQINVGVKMFRNSVKNRFKSHFSKFVYLRKTKQRGFAPGVEKKKQHPEWHQGAKAGLCFL